MLLEILLVGAGVSAYLSKNRKAGSSNERALSLHEEKTQAGLKPKSVFAELKTAILGNERQQQALILNPDKKAEFAEYQAEAKRNFRLTMLATGVALFGALVPAFTVVGIGAVLYLSRDLFATFWKYAKQGHVLNIYLLYVVMAVGMILDGHFLLLAIASILSAFAMKIIKKPEETSQHQLLDVFQGHPDKVWIEKDGIELQIDFSAIRKGDLVVVNAGEMVPVDGLIQRGNGTLDQHTLTGESQPVEREAGGKVFASTLLLSGRIVVLVETAGEDTIASNISKILTHTENYTDNVMARGQKVADTLLPVELGIGAVTAATLGFSASLAALWSNLGSNMVLLGPLSTLNYLQILSRQGILIKDGRVFESLRKVDTVVFDKTGTLTLDQPFVSQIYPLGTDYDEKRLLSYAAAVEQRQSHPVARAIAAKAEAVGAVVPTIAAASYEMGYGIQAEIEGQRVQVGSLRFMQHNNIPLPAEVTPHQQHAEARGYSLIYVAIQGQLAGLLELCPTIRPEAADIVNTLKQRGLDLYIISGDNAQTTRYIADQLGIEHYFADTLPENKADLIQQLKDEQRFVCFIGDGINDTIALKTAQVSMSIKGASSIATDVAQIVFMDASLQHLPKLLELSDEFEQTMNVNLAASVVPGAVNIAGIYLLHTGIVMSVGIFYLGALIGLGNTVRPLIKHQNEIKGIERDKTV
jgi:Cu2+-exporting ATPase